MRTHTHTHTHSRLKLFSPLTWCRCTLNDRPLGRDVDLPLEKKTRMSSAVCCTGQWDRLENHEHTHTHTRGLIVNEKDLHSHRHAHVPASFIFLVNLDVESHLQSRPPTLLLLLRPFSLPSLSFSMFKVHDFSSPALSDPNNTPLCYT